jgi:AcrR family transcriptional regulator
VESPTAESATAESPAAAEPRRRRADAARNRQRLIDAAAEVFAERGLDATVDDIAKHAGVNVATAYRHFANKHELAQAYLQRILDQAVTLATEAAAVDDPMVGLAQFLDAALELMASNRALVDVVSNAYGGEWIKGQMHELITGPIRQLVVRGQQAGVVRPDVDGTDFAVLLPMLSSVSDRGAVACVPEPARTQRYLALVLAGLRPDGTALPGRPPTDEEIRAGGAHKARAHPQPDER